MVTTDPPVGAAETQVPAGVLAVGSSGDVTAVRKQKFTAVTHKLGIDQFDYVEIADTLELAEQSMDDMVTQQFVRDGLFRIINKCVDLNGQWHKLTEKDLEVISRLLKVAVKICVHMLNAGSTDLRSCLSNALDSRRTLFGLSSETRSYHYNQQA